MRTMKRTPVGQAVTNMILDVLRLNGLICTAGDRMGAELGLTSARWQILSAINAAQHPQPVAWLARDMGGNRQNVQRIANDLAESGLITFAPNPHHKRAQLVVLTEKGRQTFDAAMQVQIPWINRITKGLSVSDIEAAHRVIFALRQSLGREVLAKDQEE